MAEQKCTHNFKLTIIGDANIGKSSLILRWVDGLFEERCSPTIQRDFKLKTVTLRNEDTCKLQIWDTAGMEKFKTLSSGYYRGSHGIIVGYDITNSESFGNMQNWINEVDRYTAMKTVKIIVGMKCDLEDQRIIRKDDAELFARNNGFNHIETSSKIPFNVDDTFMSLIYSIVESNDPTVPFKDTFPEAKKPGRWYKCMG